MGRERRLIGWIPTPSNHCTQDWADGAGGTNKWYSKGVATYPDGVTSNLCTAQIVWTPTRWPNLTNGTQTAQGGCDWASMDPVEAHAPPIIGMDHCEVSDPKSTSYSDVWESGWDHQTYTRHAQTKLKLFTGGKAIPGRQSLFVISGSATELLEKRAGPPYSYTRDGVIVYFYGCQPLPSQTVIIGELGSLGSDGFLYKALPDRVTKDVTPLVPGKQFYFFNVTEQKYHPYITLSTATTSANLDTDTPEVCVGQQVTLALNGLPSFVDQVSFWHLPPKFVNLPVTNYLYNLSCPTPITYTITNDLLTNLTTCCWYVNGGGGLASIAPNLRFSNGQFCTVAANGKFTVFRPTCSDFNNYPYIVGFSWDSPYLVGDMQWSVIVNSKYDGNVGVTQLINGTGFYYNTDGQFLLD